MGKHHRSFLLASLLPAVNPKGPGVAFGAICRTDPNIDRPALSTALQEQLGLRVASGRAPVDMLVIGRAERPAED